MTIDRMIELLKIEHECMLRKSHDECDGRWEICELVQDDGELHEMYMQAIAILEWTGKDTNRRRMKDVVCE